MRVVKEFSETIEQTTRNPIRFDSKLESQKALISESYDLKGAKLEVVLVQGSCNENGKKSEDLSGKAIFGTPRYFPFT